MLAFSEKLARPDLAFAFLDRFPAFKDSRFRKPPAHGDRGRLTFALVDALRVPRSMSVAERCWPQSGHNSRTTVSYNAAVYGGPGWTRMSSVDPTTMHATS